MENICTQCDKTFVSAANLRAHERYIHNSKELEVLKCDQTDEKGELCGYETKRNWDMKIHLWTRHDIGDFETFKCDQKIGDSECKFETKTRRNLKRHLLTSHDYGECTIFKCDQKDSDGNDCEYETKRKDCLHAHILVVHDSDAQMYPCPDCEYATKSKHRLKQHCWRLHNKGEGSIFKCPQNGCKYESKDNGGVKRHLSLVHDIGTKTCECCLSNVYALTPYTDPKTEIEANICRKCYNKATGYSTRSEKQMVEFLKSVPEIEPYIVLENRMLKGDRCETRRRPDVLISSSVNLHIIVECDESEHIRYSMNSMTQECESGRVDELLDELSSGRVVVIRWNPDTFVTPVGKTRINREGRLELLRQLITHVSTKTDWKDDEAIVIYYMFYSENNPVITTRWTKKMVYDESDF